MTLHNLYTHTLVQAAKLTCMCTSVKAYAKALDATVGIMDFRTDLALGES